MIVNELIRNGEAVAFRSKGMQGKMEKTRRSERQHRIVVWMLALIIATGAV